MERFDATVFLPRDDAIGALRETLPAARSSELVIRKRLFFQPYLPRPVRDGLPGTVPPDRVTTVSATEKGRPLHRERPFIHFLTLSDTRHPAGNFHVNGTDAEIGPGKSCHTIFFSRDHPHLSALMPLQASRYSNSKITLPLCGSSCLIRKLRIDPP